MRPSCATDLVNNRARINPATICAAGELLNFTGHHPWRPGHIHFMISVPGYQPLITQIYDADTKYLDNDSVFAVKESLIGKMHPSKREGVELEMEFNFVLKPMSLAAE